MNRFVSNRKWLVPCLFSFVLGAAALGGTGEKAPAWSKGAEAYSRRLTATKNRLALEAYEKRNAEIAPWPKGSVPANTNNAALLYYQACLFVPEPDEALKYKIRPNAGPTPEIKTYLGKCLPVIEMVETASRIPDCNWAVWPGSGSDWAPSRKLWLLANVLLLDATTLAVSGQYRVALERCLTVRRIDRHFGNDPELFWREGMFETQALYTIKILLGMMPADAEILTWFRDELGQLSGSGPSFAKTWDGRVKIQLDAMRTNPDHLLGLKETAIRMAKGEQAKQNIQKLTDEQFRSRAAGAIAQFTDLLLQIVGGNATYDNKLSKMHELCGELMADESTDPIAKAFIGVSGMNMGNQIDGIYNHHVEQEARVNGTNAAVEIYFVLAMAGKLPQELPANPPKDPFTGKDFGYEITDEGFALRCAGEEFKKRKKSLLEFRVCSK